MSVKELIFGAERKRKAETSQTEQEVQRIAAGMVSAGPMNGTMLHPDKAKTMNLLQRLRQTCSEADAIELLVTEHPDVSMASANLVALSNQGFNVSFYGPNGETLDIESQWRKFAARVGRMNGKGLDGLVDQLHKSSYERGGMCFEVVVTRGARDIEDVYLIDPISITWEYSAQKKDWIPTQNTANGRVQNLKDGNFFYIPYDAKIGKPTSRLMFAPAIAAADHQMELYQSLNTVLYRIGLPRYDVSIDVQKVVESAPAEVRNDPSKLSKYVQDTVRNVQSSFRAIGPENDFVHTNDITVTSVSGSSGMSGVDARSFREIADVEIENGTQMLGVMLNRYDSKTNALSSTEFQIMVRKIENVRRASKRAVEYIANIWLRVNGIAGYAVMEHNPVEWQTLKDKYDAQLKKQELMRKAEEYKWIDKQTAASESLGNTAKVSGEDVGFYQYLSHDFKNSEEGVSNLENQGTGQQE